MTDTPRAAAFVVFAMAPLLASAAPPATARRTALVVPTQLNGFFPHRRDWQHELDLWLGDRLRMVQFTVANEKAPSVSSDAGCFEADCLSATAKARDLDVVVAARVINDQQELTTYHLTIRMAFRAAAGQSAELREREAKCTNCSLSAVRDRLVVLEGAALANTPIEQPKEQIAQPEIQPPPPPPVLGNPPVQYEDRFSRRQRLVFKSVGLTVGGIGILALIQGFVELHHQGDIVVQNGMRYERETGTAQAALFTVGSVLVVGGGALAALGWAPLKRVKNVTLAPAGAGAQVRWAF